jgi:hypothetical protein
MPSMIDSIGFVELAGLHGARRPVRPWEAGEEDVEVASEGDGRSLREELGEK